MYYKILTIIISQVTGGAAFGAASGGANDFEDNAPSWSELE